MGGDESNPEDIAKQLVLFGLVVFVLVIMFLWGASELVALIKGSPQILL